MVGNSTRVIWASATALSLIATPLPVAAQAPAIDFGDDTGEFAKDGECDDLRFQGEGMAEIVLTDDIGRDASDCSKAFSAGSISLKAMFTEPSSEAAIMFGDDESTFARDGECDDIRFVHDGSNGTIYLAEDVGHDATDCRAGIEAGSLTWQGHRANIERGITAKDLMNSGVEIPEPGA